MSETMRMLMDANTVIEQLEAQVNELREGYAECFDLMCHWSDYASEYFQQKHDLKGDIEKHKDAWNKTPARSLADLEARIRAEERERRADGLRNIWINEKDSETVACAIAMCEDAIRNMEDDND